MYHTFTHTSNRLEKEMEGGREEGREVRKEEGRGSKILRKCVLTRSFLKNGDSRIDKR